MSEHNPRRGNAARITNHQPQRPQQEIQPIPLRSDLDPEATPEGVKSALEVHLDMLRASSDYRDTTVDSHRDRLKQFLDWLCPRPLLTEEENAERPGPDIRHTGEFHSRHLQDWQMERSQEVSPKTWQNECSTLRGFCRNLEDYGALPQGFHHYVPNPSISKDDERRDVSIDVDRGRKITEYLRKYKWGSERHVWWELIWTTAMRIGDGHSIDEDDIDWENKQIKLRHRPDQGKKLKNGEGMGSEGGERNVVVGDHVLDALEDWLDNPERADDPEDEYGRVPLFPQDSGDARRGKQFLRDLTYAVTRPCAYGEECPHDRDPEQCSAAGAKNMAFQCESTVSPHPVRSGAITRMRDNDVPKRILRDECDVSEKVLDKHYDQGDEGERAEIRREYLERDDTHRDE